MNILIHFLTLYKLSTSHMRVTNVYFCHTCNMPFALYFESKIRFTGSLFITRIRLYSRAYGSQKNCRRASREGKAARQCLHARCILVRAITLTKRRIACYFRCDLSPLPHIRLKIFHKYFSLADVRWRSRCSRRHRKKM